MKVRLTWFALLLFSASARAASLAPGLYEGLMLAVAPDGSVQGHYVESQGEGTSRRCAFFVSGQASAGKAKIESWSSTGVLPGTLAAEDDGVLLAIPGGREHAGCGLVLLPLVDRGLSLSKVGSGPWTHLRLVREPRLWFHAAPAAAARRQGYLVRGDVVGIRKEVDGWASAEFVDRGTGRRTRGWLPASGLGPVEAARPQPK